MRYMPHTDDDIARMLGVDRQAVARGAVRAHPGAAARRRAARHRAARRELAAHASRRHRRREQAGHRRDLSRRRCALVPGRRHLRRTTPVGGRHAALRSEFYTAYTPYQPEIAQGTLQAIFEFQTIVARALRPRVANASMYDGARRAAEARAHGAPPDRPARTSIVARRVHPQYAETIDTYVRRRRAGSRESIRRHRLRRRRTRRSHAALEAALAESTTSPASSCRYPNFFGVVEDLPALAASSRTRAARCSSSANTEPYAFGLLSRRARSAPTSRSAKGIGLAHSADSAAPASASSRPSREYMQQMPGRLVGETVDKHGSAATCSRLSTREQHIRRERATRNICTNQGLIALAFTIHMACSASAGCARWRELNLAKARIRQAAARQAAAASRSRSRGRRSTSSRCACAAATPTSPSSWPSKASTPASRRRCAGTDARGHARRSADVAVTERHTQADIDKLAPLGWVQSERACERRERGS